MHQSFFESTLAQIRKRNDQAGQVFAEVCGAYWWSLREPFRRVGGLWPSLLGLLGGLCTSLSDSWVVFAQAFGTCGWSWRAPLRLVGGLLKPLGCVVGLSASLLVLSVVSARACVTCWRPLHEPFGFVVAFHGGVFPVFGRVFPGSLFRAFLEDGRRLRIARHAFGLTLARASPKRRPIRIPLVVSARRVQP